MDDVCLYKVTDPSMLDNFSQSSSVLKLNPYCDVRWQNVSWEWLGYEWVKTLTFNEDTVFMPEVQGYADIIMDKRRNPGLGIRSLHAQGITGAGVNIAILDQNLFQAYDYHPEYRDKIVAYHDVGSNVPVEKSSFHGPIVTSIAVGDTIGTAPGAHVYYVAVPAWYEDAVQRANQEGILVIDGGDNIITERGWCDIEDPDNVELFICDEENRLPSSITAKRIIYVPAGNRTLAAEDDDEGRTRYNNFYFPWTAPSWVIPYASGVLALGWQVNPDLTYEKIVDLLFASAYINPGGNKIINPQAFIQMIRDNM